jgi:hypothetical protein
MGGQVYGGAVRGLHIANDGHGECPGLHDSAALAKGSGNEIGISWEPKAI